MRRQKELAIGFKVEDELAMAVKVPVDRARELDADPQSNWHIISKGAYKRLAKNGWKPKVKDLSR